MATDLDVPWSVVALPDGTALVSLRDEARVVRVGTDGAVAPVTATGPDGRVPGVAPAGEAGLLGLALPPDAGPGATSLYAYTSTATDNRVLRMPLSADRRSLGEPEVLLDGIPLARNHDGGRLAFGPDGMLYVTTGDAGDRPSAQDPGSLAGKILRLTPDGRPAPGNPDPGSPVWSLGHRNVQGVGWDADGRMYASEFGQDTLDELNLVTPGGNYGWPEVEGTVGASDDDDFVDPLVTWPTDDASPSGLLVTADAVYLAALRGQRLWRVPLDAGAADGAGDGGVTVGTPEVVGHGCRAAPGRRRGPGRRAVAAHVQHGPRRPPPGRRPPAPRAAGLSVAPPGGDGGRGLSAPARRARRERRAARSPVARGGRRAQGGQRGLQRVQRHVAREEPPLAVRDAGFAAGERRLGVLDPLGDDVHAGLRSQPRHRAHDRGRARVGAHGGHERAVELERAHRHPPQVAQRRGAGAEVVHRDHHPGRGQALDLRHGEVPDVHERALGHLDHQTVGGDAVLREPVEDRLGEPRGAAAAPARR